jgi:glycerophosphoryl diester phosphodiesterase
MVKAEMTVRKQKRPLVVAHRGASGVAPENHIVVLHDRDLKRTTGKNGKVWKLTLQQIRLLEAGSWFDQKFSGEPVPTLRQVLEMMPENISINIEVKTDGDQRKRLAFEEVCILIIMEKKCEDRVIVSSFDHRFIARMHTLYPAIKTGALYMPVRDVRKSPSSIARKTGATAFICNLSSLSDKLVHDARSKRMFVGAYVVNTEDQLRKAVDLGVDAVVTDFPGKMVRLLDKIGFASRRRPE